MLGGAESRSTPETFKNTLTQPRLLEMDVKLAIGKSERLQLRGSANVKDS
jgi:hypothetical protein